MLSFFSMFNKAWFEFKKQAKITADSFQLCYKTSEAMLPLSEVNQ